jgi:hypothetical protein
LTDWRNDLTKRRSQPLAGAMTVIEIKPHRWGWKVFEAPGVEPVFPEEHQAISYAQERASFRSGEIRILDSSGNVERVIPFDDTNRKL